MTTTSKNSCAECFDSRLLYLGQFATPVESLLLLFANITNIVIPQAVPCGSLTRCIILDHGSKVVWHMTGRLFQDYGSIPPRRKRLSSSWIIQEGVYYCILLYILIILGCIPHDCWLLIRRPLAKITHG